MSAFFNTAAHEVPITVLGISGSPRKLSNSFFFLNEALQAAAALDNVTTDIFSFQGKTIQQTNDSEDLTFESLLSKWLAADAIIWSVPVYNFDPPSLNKAAIQKLEAALLEKHGDELTFYRKPSGLIVQGSARFGSQELVAQNLNEHFLKLGCLPVIGDGAHIGVVGQIEYGSPPEKNLELLEGSRSLGRRIVETARILKLGSAYDLHSQWKEG